jgi:cbb3-type cytochrome oxidase subunit 1
MQNIDRWFIGIAVILALLGMLAGIWMSMDLAERQVYDAAHAHNNLLGWVGLALYGLIYRAYPNMKEGPLAKIHFVLAVLGTLILTIGLIVIFSAVQAGNAPDETLAKIGSVIVVLSALLFIWIFFAKSRD